MTPELLPSRTEPTGPSGGNTSGKTEPGAIAGTEFTRIANPAESRPLSFAGAKLAKSFVAENFFPTHFHDIAQVFSPTHVEVAGVEVPIVLGHHVLSAFEALSTHCSLAINQFGQDRIKIANNGPGVILPAPGIEQLAKKGPPLLARDGKRQQVASGVGLYAGDVLVVQETLVAKIGVNFFGLAHIGLTHQNQDVDGHPVTLQGSDAR
jgi:hypothetical protein